MTNIITVASLNLELHDQIILQSLVSLIRSTKNDLWEFVESKDADILFIDIDRTPDLPAPRAHQQQVFIGNKSPAIQSNLCLTKPPRAKSVRNLLFSIASQLAKRSDTQQPLANKPMSSILNLLLPESTQAVTQVSSKDCPTLLIDRRIKRVFIEGDLNLTSHYHALEAPHLSVIQIPKAQVNQAKQGLMPYNSDTFFWHLGLKLSDTYLLLNLRAFPAFQLKRWPDFGKLSHTSIEIKIASRLIMQPMSINELRQLPNVTHEHVVGFLNACYLCEWLIPIKEHTDMTQTPSSPSPKKGLFSMIRKKLGMTA